MDKVLVLILAIVISVVAVSLLLALPTMVLWNWLMPQIFKLPEITFWQALGINLLCGSLFQSSSRASSNK